MKDYCIWIVSPPGYIHSHAFDEIALNLNYSFRELGFEAPIIRNADDITDYPIILGANLIPSLTHVSIPQSAIIYNMEQILADSPWMTDQYIHLLRSFQTWDYSEKNISELHKLGVTNVHFCGLGYSPAMTRITPAEQDIDILLYGSLNDRRMIILQDLHDQGLTVHALFGVYGKDRDDYIARSKIVLNIHFFESKILEIGRIYDLLANRTFIVSETGSDRAMEEPLGDFLVFASYEMLRETCLRYIADDDLRHEIAEAGFRGIKTFSQTDFLKNVLNITDSKTNATNLGRNC